MIFNPKCTRNPLSAGLCQNARGTCNAAPDPLDEFRGWAPEHGRGREEREENEGRKGEGREGKRTRFHIETSFILLGCTLYC